MHEDPPLSHASAIARGQDSLGSVGSSSQRGNVDDDYSPGRPRSEYACMTLPGLCAKADRMWCSREDDGSRSVVMSQHALRLDQRFACPTALRSIGQRASCCGG